MSRPIHPLALCFLNARSAWHNRPDAEGFTSRVDDAAYDLWELAGCPVYATEPTPAAVPAGFVRVRVAVATTAEGGWSASGDSHRSVEDTLGEIFYDAASDRLSWIIADVPLPEAPSEIVGEVSDAE